MSDAEQLCQFCGAPMTLLQRVDVDSGALFEWQCANLHYWQQTATGMVPIEHLTPIVVAAIEYEAE